MILSCSPAITSVGVAIAAKSACVTRRRGPLVFNIQDVFPDAAVETGAITNRHVIALAAWLERFSYNRAAAVTVLSDDLRQNVVAKVKTARRGDIRVIPNFVDTEAISPRSRDTSLRTELGLGDGPRLALVLGR